MKKDEFVKCLNCNHAQEIREDKIYQDIQGKFMVCEKCESSFDVEIEKIM